MNNAIAILQAAAEVAENNAPIHESEGDHQQAALSREVARDCQAAIATLTGG